MPKGCTPTKKSGNEAKKKSTDPPGEDKKKCPLEDKIKLVELVEVIKHKGKETTKAPVARKQYINLDDKVDPDNAHPEYGRVIRLKARVEWVAGDKTRSLKGQKVYWYSTPDGKNKTGLANKEKEGFDSPGAKTKFQDSVDDKGWTDVVEFHLSQYGGDKFTVYVTEDSAYKGGKSAGAYEVWRKLWYEADTMKRRDSGLLDMDSAKLPGCFEPCFIELELEGTDNKPDNKWNLATGDLHAFGNDYFGANRSPYQAHEVAIDHQADKDPKAKLEFTLTASVFTSGNSFSFWVYDGADKWFESARYNADGSWKTLNKSKVTLVGASKVYKNVKIDLSGESVKPSPTKPVKVELKKCVLAKEWSGDGANKPHAFIAMGYWYDTETVAEAKKRTLGTMAHELGHLVGMVPKSSSTWVDTGTGWHCTDTKCVMYYSNTTTRGNEFCTVCQDVLRKEDITKYKSAFKHSKGSKA